MNNARKSDLYNDTSIWGLNYVKLSCVFDREGALIHEMCDKHRNTESSTAQMSKKNKPLWGETRWAVHSHIGRKLTNSPTYLIRDGENPVDNRLQQKSLTYPDGGWFKAGPWWRSRLATGHNTKTSQAAPPPRAQTLHQRCGYFYPKR